MTYFKVISQSASNYFSQELACSVCSVLQGDDSITAYPDKVYTVPWVIQPLGIWYHLELGMIHLESLFHVKKKLTFCGIINTAIRHLESKQKFLHIIPIELYELLYSCSKSFCGLICEPLESFLTHLIITMSKPLSSKMFILCKH